MCGESGLIRERLQGREESCCQLLENRRGKSRDSLHGMRLRLHAVQHCCGYGGMLGMPFVPCYLQGFTTWLNLLFVGIEAWRKVYTIRERVASFGQCRMRWFRLGIPNLLFLRRRMPWPIKQACAGMIDRGRTQTAVPASPSCFNMTAVPRHV